MTLIFVYGTLKRGGSNHGYLAGQAFVGAAQTAPGFTLYELAGYPGMVHQADDLAGVGGEVWSVDSACLARLDKLEGVDEGLYRREPIALVGPFAERQVEAYLCLASIQDRPRVGSEWVEQNR